MIGNDSAGTLEHHDGVQLRGKAHSGSTTIVSDSLKATELAIVRSQHSDAATSTSCHDKIAQFIVTGKQGERSRIDY